MRIATSTTAEDTGEVMHMSRFRTALVHKGQKWRLRIQSFGEETKFAISALLRKGKGK